MSGNEKLQNMLDNLINQNPEQAQVHFHDYLQTKMQGVIGGEPESDPTDRVSDEQESDKE